MTLSGRKCVVNNRVSAQVLENAVNKGNGTQTKDLSIYNICILIGLCTDVVLESNIDC